MSDSLKVGLTLAAAFLLPGLLLASIGYILQVLQWVRSYGILNLLPIICVGAPIAFYWSRNLIGRLVNLFFG